MDRLRITEIFYSLQGETTFVGLPTIFIRLTGCPLRCQYCDTAYAFGGGDWMNVDAIITQCQQYSTRRVTVTGGEPLAQPAVHELLKKLCEAGYQVSLETSGALSVAKVDPRVIKILDIKTPGSGEMARNEWGNLGCLSQQDQIKFVICHRDDYDWSKSVMEQYNLSTRYEILFSPSHEQLSPQQLAEWILAEGLAVRLQVQLHKLIWGDVPGK